MYALVLGMMMAAVELPSGAAPPPVAIPHLPNRLHAFVWRNWQLAPVERMAQVIGAEPADVLRMGRALGLSDPPPITKDQERRSYITVIRRNWHLLPYDQLLQLLGWTDAELAYTLREDDFLYIKLGLLKPACEPLKYVAPDEAARARESAIARIVKEEFPVGVGPLQDPLFGFVSRLSQPPAAAATPPPSSGFSPRYCYSYFALYGDPLLDKEAESYPDGYLARLAAAGVNGVWLQGVLYKLAPFPWDPALSERYAERLDALRELAARARTHGMGVYLYLNEPRAMPLSFFDTRPELKGVTGNGHAAMCTSVPEVKEYLSSAIAAICSAVPGLAGFFTITASENLSNCWSHHGGANCPRCGKRSPAEVVAEVNAAVQEGIRRVGSAAQLIAWDWGWQDAWAVDAIKALPDGVAFMSVSEWSIPIQRGGVDSIIGEYSISTIGPGPRAQRHWAAARARGLKTIAKIQAGNTWEIAAVPYIPAVENVARHAANLRDAKVDGLMLGWTLGGYPSPNLEVVAEMGRAGTEGQPAITPDEAMDRVARRRFGAALASTVVEAWKRFSAAFSEYPYAGNLVYTAPVQMGCANLLWGEPTGYAATMVGIPYDDLDAWRGPYPVDVFIGQFTKMANGFDDAIAALKTAAKGSAEDTPENRTGSADIPVGCVALREELSVAETAAIHFRSVANQARFIAARRALAAATSAEAARPVLETLESVLREEIVLARRMYAIQCSDSRIAFEATNHYFYVPVDLAEKALNCRDLLERWLPEQRAKFGM